MYTRLHARGGALLLAQHDFGKGTSSRSTKLVQGDGLLLGNAPHLVHGRDARTPAYQ
jgi:hypothetical protein